MRLDSAFHKLALVAKFDFLTASEYRSPVCDLSINDRVNPI